jgi:hypothetical protein
VPLLVVCLSDRLPDVDQTHRNGRTSIFRLQAFDPSAATLSATSRSAASMIQEPARYVRVQCGRVSGTRSIAKTLTSRPLGSRCPRGHRADAQHIELGCGAAVAESTSFRSWYAPVRGGLRGLAREVDCRSLMTRQRARAGHPQKPSRRVAR